MNIDARTKHGESNAAGKLGYASHRMTEPLEPSEKRGRRQAEAIKHVFLNGSTTNLKYQQNHRID